MSSILHTRQYIRVISKQQKQQFLQMPLTRCVGAIFMPLIFPPFTDLFAWLLAGQCIPLPASQTEATIG